MLNVIVVESSEFVLSSLANVLVVFVCFFNSNITINAEIALTVLMGPHHLEVTESSQEMSDMTHLWNDFL